MRFGLAAVLAALAGAAGAEEPGDGAEAAAPAGSDATEQPGAQSASGSANTRSADPAPAITPTVELAPPPPDTVWFAATVPDVLSEGAPLYPAAALEAFLDGVVPLEFGLDAAGAVTDVTVLNDPGHGLGDAAAAALRESFFADPETAGPPLARRRYFRATRFVLPDEVRARRDAGKEPPAAPLDELTALPSLSEQRTAAYPPNASEAGVGGTVQLEIDVSDRGEVDAVKVLAASPVGWGFEVEALRAVWGFRFAPAMAGPAPVPVRITYTYTFKLEQKIVEVAPETPRPGDAIDAEGPENFVGVVRESGTRRALGSVDVWIDDLAHGAVTDPAGRFVFRGIPAGLHRVIVAVPGYRKFETEEEVRPGEATDVVYFVEESPYGVTETVVRGKVEQKEVARRSIAIETIERVPGTFGDPVRVVQNLPGVARSPFDFGLLLVRGSGPEDSGVHIDGIRVPQLFHFGGLRSIVTPILLDAVDFYPGGYGGTYGRLTGGVLDVRTRTTYEPEVHGLVQADLIDASAAITGSIRKKGDPNPKAGFVLAARRSYLDIVLPALAPQSLDLSRIVFPQWTDVQGKLTLHPDGNHDVSVLAYWSQDRAGAHVEDPGLATVQASQGEFSFKNDFWRVNLDWTHRPSEKVRNRLLFAVGQDDQRIGVGQYGRLDSMAFWWMFRDHLELSVDRHLDLLVGADVISSAFRFDFEFFSFDVSTFGSDPNAEREELRLSDEEFGAGPALFAEARVKLADERIKLTPGLRFDTFFVPKQFFRGTLDPRFQARFTPDPGKRLDLKGSVGLYHQNPQGFEILDTTGNTGLSHEESFQATGGFEVRFTDFLSLDAQGFYKKLDKLVVFSTSGVLAGGSDGAWSNSGDGRIWGAEVFLRLERWKNFEGWIAFTYQRSQRRDHPEDDWYWYDFDQPVILDVVASYALPFGFHVGARFRYVSGNPQTPVLDSIYDADSDSYIPLNGTYNSDRLPSFHALDLRIDKDILFRRWKLTFYLDIQNVYNRKNPESVIYNFDYTEHDYLYSLPILPNVGFKAQF